MILILPLFYYITVAITVILLVKFVYKLEVTDHDINITAILLYYSSYYSHITNKLVYKMEVSNHIVNITASKLIYKWENKKGLQRTDGQAKQPTKYEIRESIFGLKGIPNWLNKIKVTSYISIEIGWSSVLDQGLGIMRPLGPWHTFNLLLSSLVGTFLYIHST